MITTRGNLAESHLGHVAGVVTAVPTGIVTNAELGPAADEAARMTGVKWRRRASAEQTAESLCVEAAQHLLSALTWSPATIDALVFVTQTPWRAVPASGFDVHGALGLRPACPVVPVNWSCAGYVHGLWLAMKLAKPGGRVLLLVGDVSSRIMDPQDRATGPLFGDACSATAVCGPGALNAGASIDFLIGCDSTGNDALQQGHTEYLHMDGAGVFSFALKRVPALIDDLLDIAPSPDFLLFHQANRWMLEQLARKAKLTERFTPAQMPSNIAEFGNCSCASIPLLLCQQVGQAAAQRSRLAMFGFGAGWAWGGAVVSGARMDVVELIEV